MEKPNINKPVITALDQLHFMINQQVNSIIDVARLHRKAFWPALSSVYEKDMKRENSNKFFRDFCTVRLALPQRSGLSTWCQRNLPEDALYISRTHWNPKTFRCRVAPIELRPVDVENPPDLIVVDDASWHPPAALDRVYTELGKKPETQLFLLLG